MRKASLVITGGMLAGFFVLGAVQVACVSDPYSGAGAPGPLDGGATTVRGESDGGEPATAVPTIATPPKLARANASVTLHGTGFGAAQGASKVGFDRAGAAVVDAWSDTAVTLTVPAGAHGLDTLTLTVGAVPVHVPLRILAASEPTLAAIAKGSIGAAAVREDGAIVTWGCPSFADTVGDPGSIHELCTPHVYDVATSRADAGSNAGFERLSLGVHLIGIESSGATHAWIGPTRPMPLPISLAPVGSAGFASIDEGAGYVVALKTGGTADRWTIAETEKWTSTPAFKGADQIVDVRAGWYFGLGLRADGSVVAETAFPSTDYECGQTKVPDGPVVALAAGMAHALALKKDGTVAGWGGTDCKLLPTPVPLPPTTLDRVVAIAAGYHHSLALRDDGTVVGWGSDDDAVISGPAALSGVVAIAAGRQATIAITEDGALHAWGTAEPGMDWDVTKLPSGFVARLPD